MKSVFVIAIVALTTTYCQAQEKDLSTIDGIVGSMYESISGPAGERDWDFFQSLFTKNGSMGALFQTPNGDVQYRHMELADYIAQNGPFFKENGFWEVELGRKTDQFGELAQVFSAYEFTVDQAGEQIKQKGINSIQLIFANERWWITSLQWNSERPDNLIPSDILN